MDLVSIFSTIVLVTTISTLVLAVAAYFAYKVREWRKPKPFNGHKRMTDEPFEPVFLKRHMLNDTVKIPDDHTVNS